MDLTREEAVKVLKRAPKGTKFYLHYRGDAAAGEGKIYPGGLSGAISISKKQALKLVKELLSDSLEKRGGRIPINIQSGEGWAFYWIG